ncbi:O-methyltransferase [Cryphonectria parasitica EP155]|uniref:O-methyltransferase n=1 Tax=Cryphonectria parasitica (strain ATCC 38755 / EP155) TaxID=660469 RepID=A0A9P5CR12_CRYP1|nr:O-methyltransferase [Cryphonectria parasitica EP155]KAF3766640.1 O-methyltransferase [Cryphonectria parasitica EP155]
MASLVPAPAVVAEAERLVSILRSHSGSPADQAKAVRQLDKLRCVLHTGSDALMFQALPFQVLPALNVLSDFRVFDVVPLNGSISVEALAAEVKLDPTILSRFIHIVLTQGVFREISPGLYEHTSASAIFRSDQAASFFRLGTMQFPNWWKVSDYLKTHSARDAQEATRVPYVWAHGGEGSMTYFDAIEAEPTVAAAWHDGMTMIETMQPVGGMFAFPSVRAAVEAEPHRAFIVDVGGGRGNALVSIMRECGSSYGAPMVLQDMAEVLEGEDPVRIDGVRNMPHNFYDVQPVKNAHIYYLRNVLHNHYDERSRTILRRIVDAMGPTSRVLIGEMILPGTAAPGADPFPFFMDLNMFMEGGIERTEEHWGRLLGEVGLQIEKIWRHPDNPVQSTIEARIQK